MTRQSCLGILCAAVLVFAPSVGAQEPAQKVPTPSADAVAAAKASPELVGALSKEIGGTPEQAAGAAGALFGIAKSRLKPEEFTKVAGAVPGMDSLLKAAPAAAAGVGTSGIPGAAGGLAGATSAFTKLGLKPDMVSKAVPVLTSFVSKSGGADVGKLLAGALK
jgi:Protein of unknown function VcgC/VcgE (DUF2780)